MGSGSVGVRVRCGPLLCAETAVKHARRERQGVPSRVVHWGANSSSRSGYPASTRRLAGSLQAPECAGLAREAACPVIVLLDSRDRVFVKGASKRRVFAHISDSDVEDRHRRDAPHARNSERRQPPSSSGFRRLVR